VTTPLQLHRLSTPRAAAFAGVLFALLFGAALVLIRTALPEGAEPGSQWVDGATTRLLVASVLMPFAGIAFLWFIGVVREQLGEIEDKLFSTVFLGSGLLFLAMLFMGTVTSTSLLEMLAGPHVNPDVWFYGRDNVNSIVSVYAMRMAAVFTLSVSTLGLRTFAMPRWVAYLGYLSALVLLVTPEGLSWTQVVFPCWVLTVSFTILFTQPSSLARPPGGGPTT
jgi:hypothetical protein